MAWRIEFAREAERELAALDPPVARRILAFVHERLARLDDPRQVGVPLKGSSISTFWRYRVGDWRLIAQIEDEVLRILVLRLGHRRDVYRS